MQDYPIFTPEDFFDFAASIVRDPQANEAALRSAISRAYYAVFLTTRDRLFGLDEVLLTKELRKELVKRFQGKRRTKREPGSHELVTFALEEKASRDKSIKITLYHQINQLRESRVLADYRLSSQYLLESGKQSWRDLTIETVELASQVLPAVKLLNCY